MTYMIDARLEQGVPALTLIDAVTGEKRLHWQNDNAADSERSWQALFKGLMLLSCADRISLIQRSRSSTFAEECLKCRDCVEYNYSSAGNRERKLDAGKNTVVIFQARKGK